VVGKGYFEYVVSTEIMEICKEVRGVVANSGSRIQEGVESVGCGWSFTLNSEERNSIYMFV
jgi:hypothetical protein